MAEATTTWEVGMTCEGCAKAVKGSLSKVAGVTSVTTDVPSKKVTVVGSASKDAVEAAIKKTGKPVKFVA
uniref:HMA domain-containing protein n=1 Tax=Arcella intermedia TaxID=1963864 RepID=A0A6B2LYP9_9EUKA